MGVYSPSTSFPVKCLLWQYDELMRNPLEGVNASPLEDNIFEWHGNFYFPEDHASYPGMVVHFILHLPRDFPNSTPSLNLLTTFEHSHVFGETICFSLLKAFESHFEGEAETVFWNPSRTIRSLLESVYVFLTVDEDATPGWKLPECIVKAAMNSARTTPCFRCGHNPKEGKLWPPEESWFAAKTTGADTNSTEQQVCALAMYQDLTASEKKPVPPPRKPKPSEYKSSYAVTTITSSTMTKRTVFIPSNTTSFENRVAVMKAKADELVSIAGQSSTRLHTEAVEDFRCSISGVTFDHSNQVVLGFGVFVERRPNGSIVSITTDLSPISLDIFFKGGIRKSALGAKITHFFPLAINEQHWQRANRVLPACVDKILQGGPEHETEKTKEDRLLFVVGELWKSMAVLMMKGGTHASEKVLKGFCSPHHILLLATGVPDPVVDGNQMVKAAVAAATSSPDLPKLKRDDANEKESWAMVVRRHKKKPISPQLGGNAELLSSANTRVRSFSRYPRMRHKAKCPDFGRFLPQILLSTYGWEEIKEPFIGELLTRGARWISRADRSLDTVKDSERHHLSDRAVKSWRASSTGLKLTAFQIRFALNVLPWAREAVPSEVVAAYESSSQHPNLLLVRSMYNSLGGRPTQEMLNRFQSETKKIETLGSYGEFFRMIDMPRGEIDIQNMLCGAMENSKRCGYHGHR